MALYFYQLYLDIFNSFWMSISEATPPPAAHAVSIALCLRLPACELCQGPLLWQMENLGRRLTVSFCRRREVSRQASFSSDGVFLEQTIKDQTRECVCVLVCVCVCVCVCVYSCTADNVLFRYEESEGAWTQIQAPLLLQWKHPAVQESRWIIRSIWIFFFFFFGGIHPAGVFFPLSEQRRYS